MLKLSLEAGLEELERRIDHTHQVTVQDSVLSTKLHLISSMFKLDGSCLDWIIYLKLTFFVAPMPTMVTVIPGNHGGKYCFFQKFGRQG